MQVDYATKGKTPTITSEDMENSSIKKPVQTGAPHWLTNPFAR